jgi:hypothetical protein
LAWKEQLEVQRTLNFLDGSAKAIVSWNFSNSSVTGCDGGSFLCALSTASDYASYLSAYPLLQANAKVLTSNHHSTFIFLYNSHEVVYLNQTQLGLP